MWLLDFAVSITLPFFLLAISLVMTQWMLSRMRMRRDHPALQDPVAEQQAAARQQALFELPRDSQKKPGLELETQAARRRVTGL